MVEPLERVFVDDEGVEVVYHRWPATAPAAIVQLVHGLGEHSRRYDYVASALTAAGCTVLADDHRGHGETWRRGGADAGRLGRLGRGGLDAQLADLRRLTAIAREPGLPVFLFGHSLGSLYAQLLIDHYSADYAGVVLSGTAWRRLGSMRSDGFNRRWNGPGATGYEWLSRDPAVGEAFAADPLTFDAHPARQLGVRAALALLGRPLRTIEPPIPLLIQIGSEDPLGGPESVEHLADDYRERSGFRDVEVVVYPDARHEIYNELNKDEVIADLVAWIGARV